MDGARGGGTLPEFVVNLVPTDLDGRHDMNASKTSERGEKCLHVKVSRFGCLWQDFVVEVAQGRMETSIFISFDYINGQ